MFPDMRILQNKSMSMRYVLVGGGTMGSVSPLLAIYEELHQRQPDAEFVWIGTETGPEKKVIETLGIPFYAIPTGKLRRYMSLQNITDPFRVLAGYYKAKKILKDFHPNLVLTAGSHVCVPVTKAAKKLKIPYFIHQQDIIKGLANKLMEKDASLITITFDQSMNDFEYSKVYYTSNPFRAISEDCDPQKIDEMYHLDQKRQTILITGGGTGAVAINQLTLEALGELTKQYQVIHITGEGKGIADRIEDYYTREDQMRIRQYYHPVEFVTEGMCAFLKRADVVVTRAGLSSLTELSVLAKPTIIIPIPDSHQEANARYYGKYNAAHVLDQKILTGELFAKAIKDILNNRAEQEALKKNIKQMIHPNAPSLYVDAIEKFLK